MSRELHAQSVARAFAGVENGEKLAKFGQLVEFTGPEGHKLLGFLVEKSVAIPLSFCKDSDDFLIQIAGANREVLNFKSDESISARACHALGLPLGGITGGVISDSRAFDQIMAIHLHPEGFIKSQDEFLEVLGKSLAKVRSKFEILDF